MSSLARSGTAPTTAVATPDAQPRPGTHSVRAAMRAPVAVVAPSARFQDVAMLMGALQVHCVLVDVITADASGELVCGVICDFDVLRGAIADVPPECAGAIATTDTPCVGIADDLKSACAVLVTAQRSYAVVVDAGRPVGVISTLDIARALGG